MTEIERAYESIPAYEIIKKQIVETLFSLHQLENELITYMSLGKKNIKIAKEFKASVISFYSFLRPKIIDFYKHERTAINNTKILDYYLLHPKRFRLKTAVKTLQFLTKFCEDSRVTSTKIFTGSRIPKEQDTYNV